ncbi:MAG: hypothetical protein EOL86_11560, partial [Deltaproteobacteria bacterium]|nr:hypothetical protein [Deltaproteobacteria bacterium]
MKIERLELKAFGPFTDRVLDFSSDLPGLHVVHGRNEAGKSSSLRALHALLFGFPHRTNDDFVHAYNQLLVGGRLRAADGHELVFYRRKRSKNDIFDAQDNPLPADVLNPFLHGLSPELFAVVHGINHEALVRGGQGILEQQGEVGQTLFAAGGGFASLKGLLQDLETEAGSLFKPRASSAEISQALAQYAELQRRLRAASLAGQDWRAHREALGESESRLEALNARRAELEREIRHLERLRQALPFLGERALLREKLDALGEVRVLPEDFAARRQALEETIHGLRATREAAARRLASLRDKNAAIGLNRVVLDQAEAIENIHQRLGEYRKGKADSPRLDGLRIAAKSAAAGLLRQIRPGLSVDEAEALRPGLLKRKTVLSLGQKHEAVHQAARLAEARLADVRRDLAAARRERVALGLDRDVIPLGEAVALARKIGDADAEILARETTIAQRRAAWDAALTRLGLWSGTVAGIRGAATPSPDSVDGFDREWRDIEDEARRLESETDRLVQEQAGLTRDLREIEHAAEVPTEQELLACRDRRDLGWSLVRRRWIEGEDVDAEIAAFAPDQVLSEAYVDLVARADHTADRMYREADRVRRHAAALAGIEAAQAALDRIGADKADLEARREELRCRWRALWAESGVEPSAPREMRAWLVAFEKLRFQAEELEKDALDARARQTRRQDVRARLAACLGEDVPGQDLGPVLAKAEITLDGLLRASAERTAQDRVVRDLEQAEAKAVAEVESSRRAVDEWRTSWAGVMADLGLPAATLPEEASDYLDSLAQCFAHLAEEETLRKRLVGIDRDAGLFEGDVRALAALLSPAEMDLDPPLLVSRLKALLEQASRDRAVLDGDAQEIRRLEEEIQAVEAWLAVHEAELTALRAQAGCGAGESMALAEQRCAEYLRLREKYEKAETDLARVAEGKNLDELAAAALAQDADELGGRIKALREDIDTRLDPEIRAVSERVGQEKNELARMNGGDEAARLNEDMQGVLARITRLSERYVVLKTAGMVLLQAIERYREANQTPLLAAASRHFEALTLGAFTGLRADVADSGQPVLTGVRANGVWVRVDGMSSGTRDQLYLALRLATLEPRGREALPFVVDDILINFDEPRSEATLKVLAGLAGSMQIILFTHQAHVADMALGLGLDDRVFVHRL